MRKLISRHDPIRGEFRAPASKPETQRALVMASLADGLTRIGRPLVARETLVMMEACRALGAKVALLDDRLDVSGIGPIFGPAFGRSPEQNGSSESRYIWASGSALVARLFLTIGSAMPERIVVDGKCNLRVRPFGPLTSALRRSGVEFQFFDGADRLPCAAVSTRLPGGRYRLGTDVSSQFATALAISAPLAARAVHIELTGPSYSLSYIRQTLSAMKHFGIPVRADDDLRNIEISNERGYRSRDVEITGDYTSASYILGAAFVTHGHITVSNLDPENLQGERAIIDILAKLGARIRWLPGEDKVDVDCRSLPERVCAEFDLSDCPNILPTVAALAATVPGEVRITGGKLTQNHKSPRITATATELRKAGVHVEVITDSAGFVDGLMIRGAAEYPGDTEFSDHGDHRIFMALTLFSLACRTSCAFAETPDTQDSFPEFLAHVSAPVLPVSPSPIQLAEGHSDHVSLHDEIQDPPSHRHPCRSALRRLAHDQRRSHGGSESPAWGEGRRRQHQQRRPVVHLHHRRAERIRRHGDQRSRRPAHPAG